MTRRTRLVLLVVLSIAISPLARAQGRAGGKRQPIDPAGIARLVADSGARVSVNEATGAARFVRVAPGRTAGLLKRAGRAESLDAKKNRSSEFFEAYGSIFGVTDAATELEGARVVKDRQGGTHITYRQVYRGVPVFAGELRSHFDAAGELVAVNGTFGPEILVDPNPRRSAEEAGKTAVAKVRAALGRAAGQLKAVGTTLLVFREGLAKGIPGPNHLAWQVEVGDGAKVREFVYIDAHSGKFVDQITGIQDGLVRRAYDAQGTTAPGPNYPDTPFWVEGQVPFPTGTVEADNMIQASKETYDLFDNAFGRDSFDAAGGTMDSIFNRGNGCPNASWNGLFISFCPGTTTDDVTAHEWGHAYTQYTHNLVYQWQPGALNESYSDIWGETVDRINGRGLDAPDGARTTNSCTSYTPLAATLAVNSPAAIAGSYPAGFAQFGPALTPGGLTGDVVLVDDGVGNATPPTGAAGNLSVMDGCETPFVNAAAVAGRIAMMYRGTCGFAVKAKNAQLNGAIGVIIANHAAGGNGFINMAGVDPTITIPSLSVGNANGELIRAQLGGTVNATLRVGAGNPIDTSYRWLIGEESAAFGGAIRDMWNPTCYGNAGKVSDAQYTCSTADGGGVHSNSGVPNHAYALLADGGTFNGQTIAALGLTKAAHIYFRAMSVYQGPVTDFADHADALDQSCSDLLGVNLADLKTGAPSGASITPADCAQVAKAALAVELRNPPTQCNFQPLLAQNPPPLCAAGGFATPLFHDSFDNGNSSAARWSVSHEALTADFTPRDWQVVSGLPDDRAGSAFFGADPDIGTCAAGGDESGVLHLVSPKITIPASVTAPRLTFDHWVATEPAWDGGNLKISVNGGPWVLVQAADFVYNPYNTTLATAAQGNSNPIAGQPAFSGTDGGQVGGSWGRSIVNLAPYAKPKDKIRLQFDIGNDGCGGRFGWYVDDLMVYKCH
jgi:Zn-dependent metalloprotease